MGEGRRQLGSDNVAELVWLEGTKGRGLQRRLGLGECQGLEEKEEEGEEWRKRKRERKRKGERETG